MARELGLLRTVKPSAVPPRILLACALLLLAVPAWARPPQVEHALR